MDELWVLFVIVMIIASFVEKAAKAGKRGPGQLPPQRRPPGAEMPAPRPREYRPEAGRSDPGVTVEQPEGETRAAEMIAEDFWRELTGQPPLRRPAPLPERAPAPLEAEVEGTGSWDEEALARVEAPPPELGRERASASWDYRRPEVIHEPPVIVSLESTLPEPQLRHAAFHRRLETPAAAPAVVTASPQASPLVRRLRRGEGLRESVILAEVFGRPRGLEEYSPDR